MEKGQFGPGRAPAEWMAPVLARAAALGYWVLDTERTDSWGSDGARLVLKERPRAFRQIPASVCTSLGHTGSATLIGYKVGNNDRE